MEFRWLPCLSDSEVPSRNKCTTLHDMGFTRRPGCNSQYNVMFDPSSSMPIVIGGVVLPRSSMNLSHRFVRCTVHSMLDEVMDLGHQTTPHLLSSSRLIKCAEPQGYRILFNQIQVHIQLARTCYMLTTKRTIRGLLHQCFESSS